MARLRPAPPDAPFEPVSEILHGVPVSDPWRWLEDQHSPHTREWIAAQQLYARCYLDGIPDRSRIRERVRELLDVETYDCILICGNRYIFRKRVPGQEQAAIFLRESPDGRDQLLLDPAERGTGKYTAMKPLRVSRDGQLLLYEIKQGGERVGSFEILDLRTRQVLPDVLPRGYLRSFAFAADGRSFYYVHERAQTPRPHYRAAYQHLLGTSFTDDQEIFFAGESPNLRLLLLAGKQHLGLLVFRLLNQTETDFYLGPLDGKGRTQKLIERAGFWFAPVFLDDGRLLAVTNSEAPNFRVVEVVAEEGRRAEFVDVIPSRALRIHSWMVTRSRIFVSYLHDRDIEIDIFDLHGQSLGQLPVEDGATIRLAAASSDEDELILERESFNKPIEIYRYALPDRAPRLWARRPIPFASGDYGHIRVSYRSQDGTYIPMFLAGRREVLANGPHATIMTAYGGYGVPITPQFSVLVAFFLERDCLLAVPNIRGGSELGTGWHEAAQRRRRQVAFDDFLCAAEWLIAAGRTETQRLAIFGGSNAGLLVAAAMTQRPELFRAVVCIAPILDMLRYHLFDNAHFWKNEFGTAEDPDDFAALAGYSPYHAVRNGTEYPATMIISGDRDQTCNPLHARKMTARLQAANVSDHPIILDYHPFRGHSPLLPLSERIEGLTDRIAFLCDQLGLRG